MRKMKKVTASVLSTFVLGMGILTGCGKTDQSAESEANANKPKVVTIEAQTAAPEVTRVENLEKAAEKLNEELKKQGKNIQVKVKTNVFEGSWEEYSKQFMLAFKAKKEPDIYTTGHENIGWLADGNYILPLDELKKSKEYSDVFPVLWDSVTYKGHIWGALQDTEARPVFYNKDILRKLGWSEEQINNLPEKVKNGEFTLEDMTKLAEEAKAKGLAEFGIIHRPVDGPDFHVMVYNFGGKLYDPKENKIVLDKKAVKKQLDYYYDIAKKDLIPDNLTQMEWSNIHKTVVNGKALFYYGGIWNVFNWGQDNFHEKLGKVDEKWVNEHFGMMLIPAAEKGGKGITLSHPFVYTVSSQTEHPELVKRLLELVADPALQTEHNVKTFHLPVTKGGAEHPDFKANITLGKVAYMTEYTTFLPNHEGFPKYSKAVFNAIQAVELGKKTPEEALKDLEVQLKNDLGDQLKIVE
ncbi:carbohydrate ABC transporter substrate-binding protein (CUT1 family) [Thermolongibacillus altinsuensis]|jgi:inositol-phosphate transport system substrate-binding protein|uniref:Carbohydrate ABC transporter substrate-binding protein (CUT1 family) n=1 Tax=Thermolongibacillus altinsuensis TaxID=575256 RepID=A0A4R1QD43_9BACL|nr:extracellular solute-binding protein [Thermolongibacillus altinsuensis]TCL45814.1 carbohydrate ABC transporter substrate-binding protein (CUT1 family) [Thermolongibacillus altinsuensis]GMB09738.1 sugar ABC transporter substrate-binding protein [Thermolongibacillus altinsuensis]